MIANHRRTRTTGEPQPVHPGDVRDHPSSAARDRIAGRPILPALFVRVRTDTPSPPHACGRRYGDECVRLRDRNTPSRTDSSYQRNALDEDGLAEISSGAPSGCGLSRSPAGFQVCRLTRRSRGCFAASLWALLIKWTARRVRLDCRVFEARRALRRGDARLSRWPYDCRVVCRPSGR